MLGSQDAGEAGDAGRQAAIIFVVSALVTLTALPASSLHPRVVVAVVLGHLAAAAVSWLAPWDRWGLTSTAALGLVALVLLSVTTWALDGYGSGLGPLFVLVFAWLGLHHGPAVIVGAVPVAAAGYATAMLVADARPRLVASTLVLIPIAATVGLLIRHTVRQLRATQRTLEVKDRWRAALMATLAHDVRSPLSSVTGVLEILEDDPATDQKHRRLIASAGRQTDRVVRLAMGILEVERIEQGKLRLDRRRVALADLAADVAALTQPEHVRVDVPADFTVDVDRDRLEQVLYNLTTNALRHGAPPIVIAAEQREGRTEISVRDHGSGVARVDVGNLFDRFSSADHSPHSVGLGLWIVHLLVEAHDGTVRYEPADPGARFVVSLPGEARVVAPDQAGASPAR